MCNYHTHAYVRFLYLKRAVVRPNASADGSAGGKHAAHLGHRWRRCSRQVSEAEETAGGVLPAAPAGAPYVPWALGYLIVSHKVVDNIKV